MEVRAGAAGASQGQVMAHWLLKTEPDVFSFDDLMRAPNRTSAWDGVRNYQARNFLRDGMKKGDGVLIYHSSADPPAVVGVAEVVREGYPDPTQFDPQNDHYDPESVPRARRGVCGGACLPSLHDADVLRGSAGVPGRLSLVRADLVGGPLRVLVHPSARVAGARAFFASASLLRFSGHRGASREPAAMDRRL